MKELIHAKSKRRVFKDAWAGSYNTVALTQDGEVSVKRVLVMCFNMYS